MAESIIVETNKNIEFVAETAVKKALESNIFKERPLSWVAQNNGFFLKIPKTGSCLQNDCISEKSKVIARQEYKDLILLSTLSNSVIKPICVTDRYSCLVLEYIDGIDIKQLLTQRTKNLNLKWLIYRAVLILAEIHRESRKKILISETELPEKNYIYSQFFSSAVSSKNDRKTIIIDGFEIRNMMISKNNNKIWFYDPHYLSIGYPEEDLMRLIISLLMLNWGRNYLCKIWTSFSFSELLNWYEEASGYSLRIDFLKDFFYYNMNMRESNAKTSIENMPIGIRPFAQFYKTFFFKQIKLWGNRNGF